MASFPLLQRVFLWAKTLLPAGAIRTRIGLIFFAGMSALILSTLGVTMWVNRWINLISNQLAVLERLEASSNDWQAAESELRTLLEGGQTLGAYQQVNFSPEKDPQTAALLQQAHLLAEQGLVAAPDEQSEAQQKFQQSLQQASQHLRIRRAENLGLARGLFAALFISTTCFLLIGLWFTEELIAKPLEELVQVTSRIAAGDLDTPVVLSESHEYQELANSFEAMRLELRASRERSSSYTSELEGRVAQRTRQLAALARVVATAGGSNNLNDMLHTALEQALQIVGVESGGLWLLDEVSGELRLTAALGMSESFRQAVAVLQPGEGITGQALISGQTVVLGDISSIASRVKHAALQEGIRGLAIIPIEAHEQVVGVLDVMTRQKRLFTSEEITLLTSLGQQIGIGVENARLIQEIRQQTERVAVLQERSWIGAGLHDGLLQMLGYLYLKADQLEAAALAKGFPDLAGELAHQRDVLEQASRNIRRFISELREAPSPSRSLRSALEEMVAEFWPEAGMAVTFEMSGPQEIRLEADQVTHVVRIAREALLNAARHGQAHHAAVTCVIAAENAELRIQDDGIGFEVENLSKESSEHFGLSIMRARAARIGGHLAIHSLPGQGTTVTLTWPLEAGK